MPPTVFNRCCFVSPFQPARFSSKLRFPDETRSNWFDPAKLVRATLRIVRMFHPDYSYTSSVCARKYSIGCSSQVSITLLAFFEVPCVRKTVVAVQSPVLCHCAKALKCTLQCTELRRQSVLHFEELSRKFLMILTNANPNPYPNEDIHKMPGQVGRNVLRRQSVRFQS